MSRSGGSLHPRDVLALAALIAAFVFTVVLVSCVFVPELQALSEEAAHPHPPAPPNVAELCGKTFRLPNGLEALVVCEEPKP